MTFCILKNKFLDEYYSVGDKWNECFEYKNSNVSGVMIHQYLSSMPCTYVIGSRASANVDITRTLIFDPQSNGKDLWMSLEQTGKLDIELSEHETSKTSKLFINIFLFTYIELIFFFFFLTTLKQKKINEKLKFNLQLYKRNKKAHNKSKKIHLLDKSF